VLPQVHDAHLIRLGHQHRGRAHRGSRHQHLTERG
jgi:hypothetical protein